MPEQNDCRISERRSGAVDGRLKIRMSNLVIVESPTKIKGIKKYLGKNYEVVATKGHIRDLPKSKIGIDIEHDFEPKYINVIGKGDVIKELKKEAKKSEKVYLATDPDREGEAISWHLAHILGLSLDDANRVTFNEITKSGVKAGMRHPRKIDQDLVDAQQARRVLDRLVGYQLSPFLWRKVRSGLSAGRVQSVAVRLVVDREEEIRAFVPEEYWTVDALLNTKDSKKPFPARFYGTEKKKLEIKTKEESDRILAELEHADFVVKGVKKGVRKKSPAAPFTTSTMQQEAARKLSFQAKRTMKVAQELYEGISLPKLGTVGLITYMRTDSLRISDEAREAANQYIRSVYGDRYLPETPNIYKTKSNAQDAHEAIRPTMPELAPSQIKDSLTAEQFKLYKLIWERFIASQMSAAVLDTVSVDIGAEKYLFKASGYTVRFDGYTVLYEEGKDGESEKQVSLPPLEKDDLLTVVSLLGNQHFTQPPARYTEATLIKALEENGIGRPSTYAPTISTIMARNYVKREAKQIVPTELGEVVTKLMEDHFSDIVDVKFTANMEQELDRVEEGKMKWKDTIREFYGGFSQTLKKAEQELGNDKIDIPDEVTDIDCELCGRKMVVKMGRYGKFLACSGYPECKNTKPIVVETKGFCPLCGGKILEKKSKKGKKYFGCEHNPKCGFMSWDEPTGEKCPNCGSSLLRKNGRAGKIYCPKEDCGYERGLKD